MTNEFIDKLTNEQTDNNYYVTSLKIGFNCKKRGLNPQRKTSFIEELML